MPRTHLGKGEEGGKKAGRDTGSQGGTVILCLPFICIFS